MHFPCLFSAPLEAMRDIEGHYEHKGRFCIPFESHQHRLKGEENLIN